MGHKKQMKTMLKRITTINDLKEYGFGQPWPRHGLKLLYWFANDCLWVTDDDDMLLACDPAKGVFGFHLFENKEKLLPDVDFPYYLLGNLNSPGANMLPAYVKKHNTSQYDESNADRIIITDHGQMRFGKIYLTTHKDRSSYDPYATFHITRSLLKIIQSYPNVVDFLRTLGYQDGTSNQPALMMYVGVHLELEPEPAVHYSDEKMTSKKRSDVSVDTDTPSRNCVCSCTIL